MKLNPPEKTPKRRWLDAVAFVAAVAVVVPVIMGVRTLTSNQLGQAGGTVAGLICAVIVVFGLMVIVNRFLNRHD